MWTPSSRRTLHAGTVLGVLLAFLGLGGCGQDEAVIPPLAGPSALALSIDMRAVPSILNADGVSRSTIATTVHGPDGRPAPDQVLFFQHDGDGLLFATGLAGPLQTGVAVSTDQNGVARLFYQAGTEPGRLVVIRCEPYSLDAGLFGELPRFLVIEQR
jgi:hypothetical protein